MSSKHARSTFHDLKSGAATDEPIVLDNLPEMVPVTGPELDTIETYLGNLIDGLLAGAGSGNAVKSPSPYGGKPSAPPALDRD
jgi:hypothetical protein